MKSEDERRKLAKENAKKSSKNLFGGRTKEQEEALKKIKTIGSPENLVKPDVKEKD